MLKLFRVPDMQNLESRVVISGTVLILPYLVHRKYKIRRVYGDISPDGNFAV